LPGVYTHILWAKFLRLSELRVTALP
jgi:hypothetical protein